MPKYQSSTELCMSAVTSAGMRFMRAGALPVSWMFRCSANAEWTHSCQQFPPFSLPVLFGVSKATTSCVFKEFPAPQGLFTSAPSGVRQQWALFGRGSLRTGVGTARAAQGQEICS